MALMSSNKVQIVAGDALTAKANKRTHTVAVGPAPADVAVTVSSEPNKVSHFRFKSTTGTYHRGNHTTKP